MKNPKLKLKRKIKLKGIRKLKKDISEIVRDCLLDIERYIVDDVVLYLKKRGVIYEEKKKKNTKKKKKKR